jgi:predicted ATPase
MIHLRSITLRPLPERRSFPFGLPILQSLGELEFTSPVTIFVGENGTGKSTLMEAIACAAEMVTVGSANTKVDKSLAPQRELAKYFKLTWNKRTRKGFFLRAEDFFGYTKRLNQMRADMEADLREIDEEFKGRSETAKGLARMGYGRELGDMQRRYGEGLDARSHGESFLALFQDRFLPGGLYLLDEPEAPLSPIRQLGLVALLKEMVLQDAQFIIATHSPILMAYPDAVILSFEGGRIERADFDSLEHVQLMREFLESPRAYIEHL